MTKKETAPLYREYGQDDSGDKNFLSLSFFILRSFQQGCCRSKKQKSGR
ncbi:hypothetical protein CTL2C_847 [Chlamydia trachomatis L2c]|nr:hypothetical protein CTL2C_847 [Chlamydia trachomatis L2c]